MQVCVAPIISQLDSDLKRTVGPDFLAEGAPMEPVLLHPKALHCTTSRHAAFSVPDPVHRDSLEAARRKLERRADPRVGEFNRYAYGIRGGERIRNAPGLPRGLGRSIVRAPAALFRRMCPRQRRAQEGQDDGPEGAEEQRPPMQPPSEIRSADAVVVQAGSTLRVEWGADATEVVWAPPPNVSAGCVSTHGHMYVAVHWLDAQDLAHFDRWRHNVREYLDRTINPVAEATVPVADGSVELTIPASVNLGKTEVEETRLAYVRLHLCHNAGEVLRGGIIQVVGLDGLHMIRQPEESWAGAWRVAEGATPGAELTRPAPSVLTVGTCFVPPERPHVRLWYVFGTTYADAACTNCSKTFQTRGMHFTTVTENMTYCPECVRALASRALPCLQ